jgi:hypothetical protein
MSLPSLPPKAKPNPLEITPRTYFASRFPRAHSRSTFFLILPVLVLGSSRTTSNSRGTMKRLRARLSRAHWRRAAGRVDASAVSAEEDDDSLTVTNALGRSPQCESATATTPTSRIDGCVESTDSRATEEMFSPPGWNCVSWGNRGRETKKSRKKKKETDYSPEIIISFARSRI